MLLTVGTVTLDTQQLLALALIGVYLLDSMHWLRLGEAVVITRAGGLRRLSFGSAFELGGRRPFLPNPLTPFWPELRAQWTAAATPTDAGERARQMCQRAACLRFAGVASGLSAAAIVAGGPLALLLHREDAFLVCVAVSVLCTLTAAVLLFRLRAELGLRFGQWLSLTLFALLCLPLSGNLTRAVARARTWSLPAHLIPQLTLSGADPAHTRTQLSEALRAAQRYVDPDSAESQRLAEQLRLLQEGT
jgi:hypothetical protein